MSYIRDLLIKAAPLPEPKNQSEILLKVIEDHERHFRHFLYEIADMYDFYEKNRHFKEQDIEELKKIRDYVVAGGSE